MISVEHGVEAERKSNDKENIPEEKLEECGDNTVEHEYFCVQAGMKSNVNETFPSRENNLHGSQMSLGIPVQAFIKDQNY